jgi:hypothetical protein
MTTDQSRALVVARHPTARIEATPPHIRVVAAFRVVVGPEDGAGANGPRAIGWGSSEAAAWEDAAAGMAYASGRGHR